jgi:carboxyl-terminal processing protease
MNRILYSAFILLVLMAIGCKKDIQPITNGTVDPSVKFTADTFNDLYLWYKDMPAVDLSTFKTPAQYITSVKNAKDRWSFTMTYTDMVNLLQNGVTSGWGVGLGFDAQNSLRILYAYDNSAMGKAGIKRGWQIKAINSKLVSAMSTSEVNSTIANGTNYFTFIKNDATETTLQISKGAIVINSVLFSTIYEIAGKKIGYLVFNEFLGSSIRELNASFNNFSAAGISDMVLDLRYNGGGTLDCADSLVAMLAGKEHKDMTYNTLVYNDKHTNLGFSSTIKLKSNSITLNKIVVITSKSTASASELVIAGLIPYLNLKLIGVATHGKPVGMNIAGDTKLNIAVAPISFRNLNSQGYTDYFEGIPVNFVAQDNAAQGWGDQSDGCLASAISYISTGAIGYIPTTKSAILADKIIYKGSDNPIENLYQLKNNIPNIK